MPDGGTSRSAGCTSATSPTCRICCRAESWCLTTGAALRNSPETYLQGLAEARAAGVVVELGSERLALPEAAGRIAESLNLALVALHRVIRFVDVTEAVHRLIVAEQYEEVAFDRRVHETFTELSMKRASLPGIVDTAAQMLGEPVILEDLAHQAIAVSAEGAVAATLLHDWERRSRRNTGPGGEAWTMTSVGPRSEEWGRLIIPHPAADPARAKMVLERASAALALHRMVERDRTGLQHQAQSGLIDDVLRSRITDEREVAARAQALGLRATGRYLPAVVRVDRSEGRLDPVAAHRRNVGLLDAVAHTVKAAGHTGLFSIRADGEIGVILALRRSHSEDAELTALGAGLRRETLRVDAAHTSAFALASAASGVVEAIHALGEAAHVAEVAVSMRGDVPAYFRASDVRLRGLLSLLRDDPRVQSFAETELKALVTADAEGAASIESGVESGGPSRVPPTGGKQGGAGQEPEHEPARAVQTAGDHSTPRRRRPRRRRVHDLVARGDAHPRHPESFRRRDGRPQTGPRRRRVTVGQRGTARRSRARSASQNSAMVVVSAILLPVISSILRIR